ncbi:MAG: cytochrome c biogenesis protein CcsA [Spongiibacteraceae bacterium]
MIFAINAIAISLYLLAAGLQLGYLLNITQKPQRPLLLSIGLVAVIAHAYSVINIIYYQQHFDLGFYRASSLIFWFISSIGLVGCLRRPISNLLVILFPLAAVSIIASNLSAPAIVLQHDFTPGLFSHILTSVLAYSLMSIAALQAVVLGLQERHLKHHHLGRILKALPPLQTMEQILFELIWMGMVLLTLSLISGFIFIDDIFAQHLAHKTFFSIFAWCIYAILLWGRHQLGWRSQTAARWTIGGFIALMLSYFGSKLVLELLLANQG